MELSKIDALIKRYQRRFGGDTKTLLERINSKKNTKYLFPDLLLFQNLNNLDNNEDFERESRKIMFNFKSSY